MWTKRFPGVLLVAGVTAFLFLAVAVMLTKAPWWDEGFLGGPPSNLASNGIFGSHILAYLFPRADRYLYWNMPLYFVLLAGWFKIFGFGVMVMRSLSLICGLAALASWYIIVIRLLNNPLAAALTVFLLGTDYAFVLPAVTGRMDTMTAAFGLAGLAAYLTYREVNLNRAVLYGASGVAGAVFCHPLGLIYAGIVFTCAVYLDWRKIRPRHILIALIPLAVCAGLWSIYILQAPDVFLAQMHAYSRRFHAVFNPLELLQREITGRYLMYYYSIGGIGAAQPLIGKLKVFGLIPYVAGFFLALSSRPLRSAAGGRLIIAMPLVAAFLLAIGDVIQYPQYFLHVFSFAMAALAAGIAVYWQQGRGRWLLALLMLVAVGAGTSGLAGKIVLNDYNKIYKPTVAAILPHLSESSLVDGPCELIFGLGDSRLTDGMTREAFVARKPNFIVIGRLFGAVEIYQPEGYRLTFKNRDYSVYAR